MEYFKADDARKLSDESKKRFNKNYMDIIDQIKYRAKSEGIYECFVRINDDETIELLRKNGFSVEDIPIQSGCRTSEYIITWSK